MVRSAVSRVLPSVTVIALGLALTGCSWFHHDSDKPEVKLPPPSCPQVSAIPDLAQSARFGGTTSSSGYSDVAYSASIGGLAGHCKFGDGGVTVDGTFRIAVQPGPQADGGPSDFPYFVAVLDPAGNVLAKDVFPAPVAPRVGQMLGLDRTLHQFIPLNDPSASGGYSVVVGFQLGQRQIDFNRSSGVGQ